MPERADVIVVGGGIMGCAVALALAEAGASDVRLVERDSLVDFVQNGTLFVASNEAAWGQIESFVNDEPDALTVAVGHSEIEDLTSGVVSGEGVVGGVFQQVGAQVFAPKVGEVLARRLSDVGVVVDTRRPVLQVGVQGERVAGVETARGVIESDVVVLAAGAWNNALLRPLDVYLPTVPQVTSRIVTEPLGVPRTLPTLFLMGLSGEAGGTFLWVRGHHGALLWGGTYSRHPRNAFVGTPLPGRFDEVPIDGVLECRQLAAEASRFMPLLGAARSLTLKHGAPCYTSDRRGLVGPVPGVDGLYVMAGDNEAGLTNGPGFAKVLADHIVAGSSDLAGLDVWRVDRFGARFGDDAAVAKALTPA